LVADIWNYLADRNANPQRYLWKAQREAVLRKSPRAQEKIQPSYV